MPLGKYFGKRATAWEPYDPQWLVQMAREQHPDKEWLAQAFSKCTQARSGGRAYVYFVDPSNPNKPGSHWQFDFNLTLEHPEQGEIIVDILQGQRIGGIELIKELL